MSEEIELLLDRLEQNYKCDKEQYFILYKPDIKQILDYITNLQQRNKQLKETNEKLNNVLDNIGYLIEGLIYHTDNKSTISKHNEKVLRSMLEKIDKRNVSILGDKE